MSDASYNLSPSFSGERAIAIVSLLTITAFCASVVSNIVGIAIIEIGAFNEHVQVIIPTAFAQFGLLFTGLGYIFASRRGVSYISLYSPQRNDWKIAVVGTCLAIGVLIAVNVFVVITGIESVTHPLIEQIRGNIVLAGGVAVLIVFVNAPIEEFLFRNVMQKRLAESQTQLTSIILVSVIFSLFHVPTLLSVSLSVAILPGLLILFCVSIIFGAAYEETRNLVVPVTVHMLFNLIQVSVVLW